MKIEKNILYPIFLDVASCTEDSFWKFIFKDLAFGICPYGTYIDDGVVCCKFKGKEFNFRFSDQPVKTIFSELTCLLQHNLNLKSIIDISTHHDYIQDYFEGLHPSWNEIKKKSIRTLLIEKYVLEQKTRHQLTMKQTKKMLSEIMLGFQFKSLLNQDVEYDSMNYKILSISKVNVSKNGVQVPNIFSECKLEVKETEKLCLTTQRLKFFSV